MLDYSEVILHFTSTLRLGEGLGVNMKLAYISENGDSFIQYTSLYNFYTHEEFHKKNLRNNFLKSNQLDALTVFEKLYD